MSLIVSEQVYGTRVRQNAGTTITNSTAETNLFTYTVAANRLGTTKVISFYSCSRITTPILSIPTITIRAKLGGVTFATIGSATLSLSQSNVPFSMSGYISLDDAPNLQSCITQFLMAGTNAPITLGTTSAIQVNDLTVDTTSDQAFQITVQFGGLSATTSIIHEFTQLIIS